MTNQQQMASQDERDPRISKISSVIRVIPDFPKPGKELPFTLLCILLLFCFSATGFSFAFINVFEFFFL